MINQSHMNFGINYKNDFDRVYQTMYDNSFRDTLPSHRTIIGDEVKVMNLRPL
jgi:uncharacterized surface anchored protein